MGRFTGDRFLTSPSDIYGPDAQTSLRAMSTSTMITSQDPRISGEDYPGGGDEGGTGNGTGSYIGPMANGAPLSALDGSIFGEPVTWWALILGAGFVVYYLLHERGGMAEEFAFSRWSLSGWFWDGMKAVTFLFAFKASQRLWPIPGLAQLAGGS